MAACSRRDGHVPFRYASFDEDRKVQKLSYRFSGLQAAKVWAAVDLLDPLVGEVSGELCSLVCAVLGQFNVARRSGASFASKVAPSCPEAMLVTLLSACDRLGQCR